MATKKVLVNGRTAFELRCATADGLSVMDVLPPARHPSGSDLPVVRQGFMAEPAAAASPMRCWCLVAVADEKRDHTPKGDPTDVDWDEVKSALAAIPASL